MKNIKKKYPLLFENKEKKIKQRFNCELLGN